MVLKYKLYPTVRKFELALNIKIRSKAMPNILTFLLNWEHNIVSCVWAYNKVKNGMKSALEN